MSSPGSLHHKASTAENVLQRTASHLRDQRVDLVRGIALLMIFIDHTSGNMFSKVTLLGLQHTDAAHLFIFLSGFSCMAAYGASFGSENFAGGLKKILERCLRLYVVQIVLMVCAVVLVVLVRRQFPSVFVPEQFPMGISDSRLFQYSMESVLPVILLLQAPDYFDLLRLYILLILLFPAIVWGIKRVPRVTLLISVALWVSTRRPIGLHIDDYPLDRPWAFNPFAWQLLFVLGAYLRHHMVNVGGLPRFRILEGLCWAIVLAAFVYSVGRNIPAVESILPHLKIWRVNLQPLQLLNTLALLYIIFTTRGLAKAAQTFLGRFITACGRHSLMIYAAGTVMSLVVDLCFMAYGSGPIVQILATTFGCLCLIAIALDQEKRRLRNRQAAA